MSQLHVHYQLIGRTDVEDDSRTAESIEFLVAATGQQPVFTLADVQNGMQGAITLYKNEHGMPLDEHISDEIIRIVSNATALLLNYLICENIYEENMLDEDIEKHLPVIVQAIFYDKEYVEQ